jgi:hypothetical protein
MKRWMQNSPTQNYRKKTRVWMMFSGETPHLGWEKVLMKTLRDSCRKQSLKRASITKLKELIGFVTSLLTHSLQMVARGEAFLTNRVSADQLFSEMQNERKSRSFVWEGIPAWCGKPAVFVTAITEPQ